MTIRTLSIPLDTHKRHGTCNIPLISKQEFIILARRVDDFSENYFHKAKFLISCSSSGSYLAFPRKYTLNHLLTSTETGLRLVCESDKLWIGFIPDLADVLQNSEFYGQRSFIHYRLNDFLSPLDRIICKDNSVSLVALPSTAEINQETQQCLINNVSLLMLFDRQEKNGALLCCKGLLPLVSLSPVLCPRQITSNIQNIPLPQAGNVVIPFLQAKRSGFVHFPIWSLDYWKQERKNRTTEGIFSQDRKKILIEDTFIFYPCGVSLDQHEKIEGIDCAFIMDGSCLQMAFFPKEKSAKTCSYTAIRRLLYFFETFSDDVKNHYLSGKMFSLVTLANNISFVRQQHSNNLELRGSSLFFLASENGKTCCLCYKKGNFELKCTRLTNPEKGFFPIKTLLEQSSAVGPLSQASPSRLSPQPGPSSESMHFFMPSLLSQPARSMSAPQSCPFHDSMNLSILPLASQKGALSTEASEIIEQSSVNDGSRSPSVEPPKKRSRKESSEESFQSSMEESRKEDEERKECAEALILLWPHEQPE